MKRWDLSKRGTNFGPHDSNAQDRKAQQATEYHATEREEGSTVAASSNPNVPGSTASLRLPHCCLVLGKSITFQASSSPQSSPPFGPSAPPLTEGPHSSTRHISGRRRCKKPKRWCFLPPLLTWLELERHRPALDMGVFDFDTSAEQRSISNERHLWSVSRPCQLLLKPAEQRVHSHLLKKCARCHERALQLRKTRNAQRRGRPKMGIC